MTAHSENAVADPHATRPPGSLNVHPLPVRVLMTVYVALLILTVLTVGVTYIDLGSINIWVALLIAVVKGALVVLYFMHLRYDGSFYAVALITALLFVCLFLGVAMLDSHQYQGTLVKPTITVAPQQ